MVVVSSFSSFVVLGNGKGKVGFAQAKAKQVPNSIDKAVRRAEKNVKAFPVVKGTIPHAVTGRYGSALFASFLPKTVLVLLLVRAFAVSW